VARREIPVAIAALVLWVLTAAAGLALLMAGGAAKRAAAQQAALVVTPPVRVPVAGFPAPAAGSAAPVSGPAVSGPAVSGPAVSGPGASTSGPAEHASGPAAAPGRGEPPDIPRVKVHATPGEHPLLEFSHPLLGLIGLGFWFVFVGTRHAPLAWASFGILMAAIAAGLSWLARNTLAARRGDRPARAGFPPRLILLHGFTAGATFVLAVLTALTASHL
jgi:hypothetical protein